MILSLFNIVLAATSTYLWDVPLPPAPSGYLPSELSLASLLTYLYYWGLGIGGLLAFIRLIIAGIQWGAAAGNVNSVKSAQDTMISSVFGLILLLGAWLLLNTINPQIVDPGEKITEALHQPKYESEGLKTELVDLQIDKTLICINHFPYEVWEKDKFIHLHGHTHSKLAAKERRLDVGLDNAFKLFGEYRPFSWEEIKTMLL